MKGITCLAIRQRNSKKSKRFVVPLNGRHEESQRGRKECARVVSSNNVARDWPKGEPSQTSVENLKKGRIVKDDQGCHLINIFMAEQPSPRRPTPLAKVHRRRHEVQAAV